MLEKTKGIVLKTIKYGDTSLIGSVFTEKFGLQSYIIKGVRSHKSKQAKASLLFPSSLLEMVVYHNPQKKLQLVKEFQADYFYQDLGAHIIKNGIAVFAMEFLMQLLITDDAHGTLFLFTKDFLIQLDQSESNKLANFPLFFLIQSGRLSGYYLSGSFSTETPLLDLSEGRFTHLEAIYPPFITSATAEIMSRLNHAKNLEEIKEIKMSKTTRKAVLNYYLAFFQKHLPHFKELKSVAVLAAILN